MSDYVFAYTRAQALEDGVLRNISDLAKEAGFCVPVAMTQAAWSDCIAVETADAGQDETGRVWDVLACLKAAIPRETVQSVVHFSVLVLASDGYRHRIPLKAICGPGDTHEPVITIMLPFED